MLYLRINIPIIYMVCRNNPDIKKLDNDNNICLNCLTLIEIIDEKNNDCCNNMNINNDTCINCGTIHQIFTNKLDYQENDAYQTNVLYKIKKIHNSYINNPYIHSFRLR